MIKPGAWVKCEYRGDHVGMVLRDDDPLAWAGSLAFPESEPDPIAVRDHVAKVKARGDWDATKTPVLWAFKRAVVHWDSKLKEV